MQNEKCFLHPVLLGMMKYNFRFSYRELLYTHIGCVFVGGDVWCVHSNHGKTRKSTEKGRLEDDN